MATQQQLMEAINRSKAVSSRLDANPTVPAASARGSDLMSRGTEYDQYFSGTGSQSAPIAPRNPGSSRLPKEIVESMTKHPIGGGNPLDEFIDREKPINEQTTTRFHHYTPQSPVLTGGYVGGVDYSIIKAIVNECLNEYFKRPLNESAGTLSGIGLKEGKIKLVDNKGNIFSANLEYQGSTKKNKSE